MDGKVQQQKVIYHITMFIYEPVNSDRLLLHLHGFASNVKSSKVQALRDYAVSTGSFSFFAMDMEYHTTTTSRSLEILDILLKGFKNKYKELFLSGSSHGAYVVLNYLRFYTEELLKGVLLFAPSYSTLQLTLDQEGIDKCKKWLRGEEELRISECETGTELVIHKDFARDILDKGYEIIVGDEVRFPKDPAVDIVILHGTQDRIVSVSYSRVFTQKVKIKRYIELEDDHRLSKSFYKILAQDKLLEIFD
ncbi:alpha/beta hydrolase [Hydrogenobacter thermophilus]|uniref:alpha/beta hydrolase n=1 Tax=Hydrogenobacter thermophilus TaxID=940 RepID=UPI0030FC9A06